MRPADSSLRIPSSTPSAGSPASRRPLRSSGSSGRVANEGGAERSVELGLEPVLDRVVAGGDGRHDREEADQGQARHIPGPGVGQEEGDREERGDQAVFYFTTG